MKTIEEYKVFRDFLDRWWEEAIGCDVPSDGEPEYALYLDFASLGWQSWRESRKIERERCAKICDEKESDSNVTRPELIEHEKRIIEGMIRK